MNKLINVSKSNYLEIRNYEKSNIPFDYFWDMTKQKGTIFLVNKHVDPEFLFITDGEFKIHLDNNVYCAKKGDIIVINSNILHNIIPVTDTVTYQCIVADKNFFLRHNINIDSISFCEIIKDGAALFEEINIIRNVISEAKDCYAARAYMHFLNIILTLYDRYSVPKGDITPDKGLTSVEESIRYINKHFGDEITVEDIARHIGYSKFYFCRRFKEITGYTVATYINMQRVKYANKMLLEDNMNVSEVAASCGFRSGTYFSTTFKKYTGKNPSDVVKNRVK